MEFGDVGLLQIKCQKLENKIYNFQPTYILFFFFVIFSDCKWIKPNCIILGGDDETFWNYD